MNTNNWHRKPAVNFTFNRFFMKLFNTGRIDGVRDCQSYFTDCSGGQIMQSADCVRVFVFGQ